MQVTANLHETLDGKGGARQYVADPADRLARAHDGALTVPRPPLPHRPVLRAHRSHGQARLGRVPPGSDGTSSAHPRRHCAHALLCCDHSRSRLYGRRATSAVSKSRSLACHCWSRRSTAGRGCLLLGSHLGSFDLLMLAQRSMDGRPVSVMMRVDPRARVRRIAGIDDQEPQSDSNRPTRQLLARA